MLARAKGQAIERINSRTGEFRKRAFTDITGQDAVYLEKRAEAVAYVAQATATGEPEALTDYPLLQAEVGITAATAWQLAQVWLHRSDSFRQIGAATEGARMQAQTALATARDEDEITAIEAAFNEALSGLSI